MTYFRTNTTTMRLLVLSTFVVFPAFAHSQARVVLNNNAYITFSGGTSGTSIYMVVDNGNANAVTTMGTGGNIVSEGEWNILKWNISNNTGTYVVPFNAQYGAAGDKMPLTVQITGAGTAGGFINFSTYRTAAANNLPWASRVNHMLDAATATVDHSAYVVDRWWIMDNSSYATRPAVNMTIGYCDDNAEIVNGNLLNEANLVAQRWNDPLSAWQGNPALTAIYYGAGTLNMGAQTLGPFAVSAAEFHETWVLVDRFHILPIELLSFTADCEGNQPRLLWTTASEEHNDYFSILRGNDGQFYQVAGVVDAGGNPSALQQYEFVDAFAPAGLNYYKLQQTDLDGNNSEFAPVTVQCDMPANTTFGAQYSAYGNEITATFQTNEARDYTMEVFDDRGGLVYRGKMNTPAGASIWRVPVNNLAAGMYLVSAVNENERLTTKVVVSNN
jgi:hypothetical protein